MSATTIGAVTSRVRNIIKATKQDSFLTDKFLYSLFRKHAALAIKRLDEKKSLMAMNSIYETLDFVELEETDKVEAGCMSIKSYATFRRTCKSLPVFTEGKWGPMIRSITSLDGSTIFKLTTHDQYQVLSRNKDFRYNTWKYAWFLNDRLYFPNVDYPAVRIEGMFEEDISTFKCNYDDKCKPRQQQSLNVPDYILSDIEKLMLADLGVMLQLPSDPLHDNVSITK